MQTTTNIGLKTYEASDPTDWLGEFNYNMNKIDQAVGSQNDQIEVIEETASTAVNTANTASSTAEEALTTAEGKTSVNDNVASATTTYSSNKINELISGIQPGTEIDDSVTSLTKTWSSSKINTEVSTKASINDTTASNTTTYSSNHIKNALVKKPTIVDDVDITSILSSGSGTLPIRPWDGTKFLYYIGVKNGANKYVTPYVFMDLSLDCIINVNGVNIELRLSPDGETLYITKKSGTLNNNYYLTIYSLYI